ncbi:MAG TPA: IPExxxVDY family protein [Flavobacteriaceae bacterium]|nr:IPExxxVDY family protein [Flavobacteriaceae bacterium]MCB9212017.1 IPExxxVDY family protein [Alteromonas sp.]HPF09889.1 IPExxxVDY family protein [Flavobacteriaceae bacterium]HQU19986.1 IPExxxVDY family protein [Flavobacteriaceae bacterium]HQU64028.1 IPExxxVDY family protein [Flavobacteriaceae bacterium]
MAHHKLVLDDDLEEDYSLIAIHCSEEAYKMAFLLNHKLQLRLQRRRLDLDFTQDGLEVTFPIFRFENEQLYSTYYLVSNKCHSRQAHLGSAAGLFSEETTTKNVTTYLLPEFKKVDYLIKIETDFENTPIRKTLSQVQEIKEVISAYVVESEHIKSKKNLIFH